MCDRYNTEDYAKDFDGLIDPLKETIRALSKVDYSSADELARFFPTMPPWAQAAFRDLQTRLLTDSPRPPDFLPREDIDDTTAQSDAES
jgi:hypothetical protein